VSLSYNFKVVRWIYLKMFLILIKAKLF
jgi:hypothetical protein